MRFLTIASLLAMYQSAAWTTTNTRRKPFGRYALSHPSSPFSSSSQQQHQQPDENNNNNNNNNPHNNLCMNTFHAQQQQPQELQVGRILEGGKVIDFSSVKASSRAETALAQARLQTMEKELQSNTISDLDDHETNNNNNNNNNNSILGINEDVINAVGHELGQFADNASIQACAAYLLSRSRKNGVSDNTSSTTTTNGFVAELQKNFNLDIDAITTLSENNNAHHRLLQRAYEEAGEVTAAYAKTFYMGTMLLPETSRRAIWAIYVWCRRTDEIVDAPRDDENEMLLDLSRWEMRLEELWTHGRVEDVYDLCLLDVRMQYPELEIQPFLDMIRGMLMDVPGLGQEQYDNFDQLHLYCYRVAGTVGVMSLPIFGCAPGFTNEEAREPALSLGVAFQLTNILRDVGEDAVQRGRIYLPQEDLQRFGVTEEQIREQRLDDNYRALMKFQIDRARMYYARARRGIFMLAPESRLPVQSSLDAYGRILEKIEENDYDSLTKRAYVDKWEKLSIIPFSWYRTTDLSQVLPLPGEKPVNLSIV